MTMKGNAKMKSAMSRLRVLVVMLEAELAKNNPESNILMLPNPAISFNSLCESETFYERHSKRSHIPH